MPCNGYILPMLSRCWWVESHRAQGNNRAVTGFSRLFIFSASHWKSCSPLCCNGSYCFSLPGAWRCDCSCDGFAHLRFANPTTGTKLFGWALSCNTKAGFDADAYLSGRAGGRRRTRSELAVFSYLRSATPPQREISLYW